MEQDEGMEQAPNEGCQVHLLTKLKLPAHPGKGGEVTMLLTIPPFDFESVATQVLCLLVSFERCYQVGFEACSCSTV